ncbi:MAG: cytochrome [Rhodospirillales bacterium]|nr:cytochrome [Rhodospirillales bacterium]
MKGTAIMRHHSVAIVRNRYDAVAIVRSRYDAVAIILHWVIALGILVLIAMGLAMTHLGLAPMAKFQLYQLHKSIGITVLLAVLLRVLWRLTHKAPPLPAMPPLEKAAAESTHGLLYLLMLIIPLSGWALVSVSPFNLPTVLYGLVPWPHLPVFSGLADKAGVEAVVKFIHGKLAWVLTGMAVLHAGAALRHHFILRDGILGRMLPFGRRATKEP